jgi:LysM repeat protein
LQKDVDRLNAENQTLKQQLEALKTQLAYAIGANQGRTEPARYTASPGTTTTTAAPRPGVPAAGRTRVHVVQAHETLMTIAAQYGVKVSNILAANPQVNPKRLRIGQSLNVP